VDDRLERLEIRAPTDADVPELVAHLLAGFEVYRDFQPPGWSPPPAERETERMRVRIASPSTWALVARDGREVVGQVLFEPVRDADAFAHFANLFVSRAWWGSGLAKELHGRALAAMRERGFGRARLATPAAQARARAFYEREGWRADGEPFEEPALDMVIVRYLRDL
jgi:RimJ/RimL family protein N-acetyltransferase